jgi:meso-butanediol dehydrogenase/(S,S)-butanediol dehydrogenase/diacetyl reductase
MELAGQVAIVTGSGKGIGRAIALELADMGADLVLAELEPAAGELTASDVRARGRAAITVPTDVRRQTDLDLMVRHCVDRFGRVDILVNNAGVHRSALPWDVTEEHWDTLMTVNAKAVFFATQAVLRLMIAARRGTIINVASMAAKVGSKTSVPYAASKGAVVSMTRGLALACAEYGIRVNCVCPGYVGTDMPLRTDREMVSLLGLAPGEYLRRLTDRVPMGRPARPEEVAHVVGFLASSRAGYMTGQAINVCGGLVMH